MKFLTLVKWSRFYQVGSRRHDPEQGESLHTGLVYLSIKV